MTVKNREIPSLSSAGADRAARKQARQAAALRANLGKRKAQAREREADAPPMPPTPPNSPRRA